MPSRYSWFLVAAVLGVVALSATLVFAGVGGERGVVAAADIGEMIAVGVSAVAILRSAAKLGSRTSVGRPWLLIGVGALMYAIGDAIWTVMEVGLRADIAYPGISDIFYLLEYPFVAAGILSAGLAFRQLVPMRKPI
ncbi:MAG: hypothetical protein FDZ75_07700, partial [Actinobacteria bacterium]